MLFCVQIVHTNNNESSWRKMKKELFRTNKPKNANLTKKQKNLIKKNLIDKIHN
jgi:hypothetical protein